MWKKARTLGRGSFGLVSLAISQPNDESKLNLPSLMAVQSTETFQYHSLQKESNLLTELNDCPNILRCCGSFISNDAFTTTNVPLYNIILEYAYLLHFSLPT
ncbi:Mitogen-activated protein kinase kinase kinase 18 [Camellia lanceoleosa]|uniref:Mitogen-activated protein kinase kinase kinase 18 n=1 Tax=Camellia lanceoleosa TaxID=1840588 RepID=A0ACC0FCM4_9ERIC|nr:Mitogen-activated protein kinase kinase kinase 18 [Camellia lanceoleosa]